MVHKQNTREGNIMLKIVILNFQFQTNFFVYMLENKSLNLFQNNHSMCYQIVKADVL